MQTPKCKIRKCVAQRFRHRGVRRRLMRDEAWAITGTRHEISIPARCRSYVPQKGNTVLEACLQHLMIDEGKVSTSSHWPCEGRRSLLRQTHAESRPELSKYGGFPRLGGYLFEVPIIRILAFWGPYWGSPILGNVFGLSARSCLV